MTTQTPPTIPADDFGLDGDRAWWIVDGPPDKLDSVEARNDVHRVFDVCIDGRHTWNIQVSTFDLRCDACGGSASVPLGMECYGHAPKQITVEFRVSVVSGMVRPIYSQIPEKACIVMYRDDRSDTIFDVDGRNHPVNLPDGKKPGRFAVLLNVQRIAS